MTAEQIIDKLERGLIVTSLSNDDIINKINAFYGAKYSQWDIQCTHNDGYITFVKKGEFILHETKQSYIDKMMVEHDEFMRRQFEKVWEEGHKQYEK